jgi:hypothetical protein
VPGPAALSPSQPVDAAARCAWPGASTGRACRRAQPQIRLGLRVSPPPLTQERDEAVDGWTRTGALGPESRVGAAPVSAPTRSLGASAASQRLLPEQRAWAPPGQGPGVRASGASRAGRSHHSATPNPPRVRVAPRRGAFIQDQGRQGRRAPPPLSDPGVPRGRRFAALRGVAGSVSTGPPPPGLDCRSQPLPHLSVLVKVLP